MKLLINEFAKDYKKKTTYLYLFLGIVIVGIMNYAFHLGKGEVNVYDTIATNIKVASSIASMFILIIFANNLSQEYSKGTIKFLYSKPKSRSSILTAKIVVAFLNYIVFYAIHLLFSAAALKVLFGEKINLRTVWSQTSSANFGYSLSKYSTILIASNLLITIFFISLVLLICTLIKTQILSIIIVLFMMIGGSAISLLTTLIMSKFEYIKYLFVNVNLLAAYYDSNRSRDMVIEFYKLGNRALLIMAVTYIFIFMLISYIINSRRDITID